MPTSNVKASICVTIVSALLVALFPLRAGAHERPSSYCSETGDLCLSARKIDGIRKLTIHLSAKYFGRYHLCVETPVGTNSCEVFRIHRRADGTFGDSVLFKRYWGDSRRGLYEVRWYRAQKQPWPSDKVGRTLGFRVR